MLPNKNQYADIALNTKTSKRGDLFTYLIPEEMQDSVAVGQIVLVPLGKRKINGIIINIHNKKPQFITREIIKIIDLFPLMDKKQIDLAEFISHYYWCGFSQALFAMLPPNLRRRRTRLGIKNNELRIKNKNIIHNSKFIIRLNSYQKSVLEKIKRAIKAEKTKTFLLHGVTNSGKTEVYLRAFAEILKKGGQGIFIVPEISLTPQTIERFEKVFSKKRIAVIHSKLKIGERLKAWVDIKEGKKDIVIGSRSAIFAPLSNLKLIIVDEEHDLISFKSDQTPRYELHKVAEKLAEISNAILIFGSATPLVESYYNVLEKRWEYLSLPERIDRKAFPRIKIIDMTKERRAGNYSLLSEYLFDALNLVLKNKRQALIFLNRRGMATLAICNDCGEILKCQNCEAALVYHSFNHRLCCHHCGKWYDVPIYCPRCRGVNINFSGKGTERVEKEIKHYFPQAKIARMDRDAMLDAKQYRKVFQDFQKQKIDILVGTQMIVHGWDIPSVDLAGIIDLDAALNMPDFRASEKIFQLILQLAGRTGRKDSRGLLVLQTQNPDHWLFRVARRRGYVEFVKGELDMREKFGYPPFSQIIKLSLAGKNREKVENKAQDLKDKLERQIQNTKHKIQIIGPVYPLIPKKYGKWWQNIIIKCKMQNAKCKIMESLRDDILENVPKEWVIDVDPLSLL